MGFDRYAADELRSSFQSWHGADDWRRHLYVQAPGRTELAGNHTDHEGGSVIAAAVDRYVRGVFAANEEQVIRVVSEGYDPVELRVDELAPREGERTTTGSLVRGLAALFAERGFAVRGFDAYLTSGVPAGSGLSSSAAFELAVAQAMNVLFAKGLLSPEDLALMAQRAEREWFGKPCGLMDQAAVALGGIQHMSFAVPGAIDAQALDLDFAEAGYAICLVAVGADHAANTDDYAAVPADMQAVARLLGKERLGELREADLLEGVTGVRGQLGDRALLRALHYFREERLVAERADALAARDMARFVALTRDSGASSAMYLQNVSVAGAASQPAMVALALADELLPEGGAARIHGGGFGGTIQAFVPLDKAEAFALSMDAALGTFATLGQGAPADGPCQTYAIDHEGARAWWM